MASSVHASQHGVDRRNGDNDIGQLAAFADRGDGLEVVERRVAEVRPVGARAAVGDQVHPELAPGRLDGDIGLAGGDVKSPRSPA